MKVAVKSVQWGWLILCLVGVSRADHWGYPVAAPNGEVIADENWGGKCDEGMRQSPIDLSYAASVQGYFDEFDFSDYEHVLPQAKVLNNGHSLQIYGDAKAGIILKGGGLEQEYVFDQMHFHWGSEHTIDGRRYALELHIVHHDRRYSLRDALQVKNGIAVLGVLFHISAFENDALQKVLGSLGEIATIVGMEAPIAESFRAADLLPRHRQSYFRYEGSLTTPSCSEAVVWTVFTKSLPLSLEQLESLKMVKSSNGTDLLHNYRQVQPLNARALIHVTSDDVEEFDEYKNGGSGVPASFTVLSVLAASLFVLLR